MAGDRDKNGFPAMTFFLLAGGSGTRVEPLSRSKPKPLFPLNGDALLRLLLSQLARLGLREGFINLRHLGEQIRAAVPKRPRITFIEERRLSGCRVVKKALNSGAGLILVLNGDVFLEIPLAVMREKMATTAADGVLLVRNDLSGAYRPLRVEADDFFGMASETPAPGVIFSGVALLNRRTVAAIHNPNIIRALALEGGRLRIKVVRDDGIWLDIGDPWSYLRANFAYRHYLGQGAGNACSPGVYISRRAAVSRSVIWENTRILGRSRISECLVAGGLRLQDFSAERAIVTGEGVFPLPFSAAAVGQGT